MVRFTPLAEAVDVGYLNPALPPPDRQEERRKSRGKDRGSTARRASRRDSGLNSNSDPGRFSFDGLKALGLAPGVTFSNGIDPGRKGVTEGVWWTPVEMHGMKLMNMVEWTEEVKRGGWSKAPEEHDMHRCRSCYSFIHPVHQLEDQTIDECDDCFRCREKKELPWLKKRNLKSMMERKALQQQLKRKAQEDRERRRALPKPTPPLWQRAVALLTGVVLSDLSPFLFGDYSGYVEPDDDLLEADDAGLPVKSRFASVPLAPAKRASIFASVRGSLGLLQHNDIHTSFDGGGGDDGGDGDGGSYRLASTFSSNDNAAKGSTTAAAASNLSTKLAAAGDAPGKSPKARAPARVKASRSKLKADVLFSGVNSDFAEGDEEAGLDGGRRQRPSPSVDRDPTSVTGSKF